MSHLSADILSQHPRLVDDRVLRLIAVIQSTYADPELTLAKVASIFSISRSRLQHLVKRDTGISFSKLLHNERIRRAADLLRSTTLAVKEVAAKAGYPNSSSLERHFKAILGCTPTEFRSR